MRVYRLIRPVGSVADAPIVPNRSDGGLYVVVEGTAHPVLNLASARLVAGSAAEPKTVAAGALRDLPRGPTLGIVGAPNALGSGAAPAWTVCDAVSADGDAPSRTVVVIGDGSESAGLAAGADAGLFVVVDEQAYLVYQLGQGCSADGARPFDADAEPVRRALGLHGAWRTAVAGVGQCHRGGGTLAVPDRRCRRGRCAGDAHRHCLRGAVLDRGARTLRRPGRRHCARHRRGRPDAAPGRRLVVGTGAHGVAGPRRLWSRVVDLPATAHFPVAVPRLVSVADAPVICQRWYRPPGAPAAVTALLTGHAIPGPTPVVPVGADGSGPRADGSASHREPPTTCG